MGRRLQRAQQLAHGEAVGAFRRIGRLDIARRCRDQQRLACELCALRLIGDVEHPGQDSVLPGLEQGRGRPLHRKEQHDAIRGDKPGDLRIGMANSASQPVLCPLYPELENKLDQRSLLNRVFRSAVSCSMRSGVAST